MNDMIVKSVDLMGDTVIAAQDKDGNIWAGVSYFCNALGMNKKQKDWQTEKVQSDKILSRGAGKFGAGVFDPNNETIALRIDFVPLWLTKISITKQMEKDHPELADKLLNYQLKAKDILAAAFLPNHGLTENPMELLKLHYEALKVVGNRIDKTEERIEELDKKLQEELMNLPILGVEESRIEKATKQRGTEVLGGKQSNAYKNNSLRGRLYWDLHIQLRREFGVSTYKAIKRNQADMAMKFIREYNPPMFLAEQISNENLQEKLEI